MKPIRILYLTPLTTDSRILSQWVRAGQKSWPTFILEFLFRGRVPEKFPLQVARAGYFPEQLVLCDYKRWPDEATPTAAPSKEEEEAKAAAKAATSDPAAPEGEKK